MYEKSEDMNQGEIARTPNPVGGIHQEGKNRERDRRERIKKAAPKNQFQG